MEEETNRYNDNYFGNQRDFVNLDITEYNIATLFNAIGKHMNYTNADGKRKWTVLGECLLGHLRVIGHDFYFIFFHYFDLINSDTINTCWW